MQILHPRHKICACVLNESSMLSWSNFGREAISGKVRVANCLQLWKMAPYCSSVESHCPRFHQWLYFWSVSEFPLIFEIPYLIMSDSFHLIDFLIVYLLKLKPNFSRYVINHSKFLFYQGWLSIFLALNGFFFFSTNQNLCFALRQSRSPSLQKFLFEFDNWLEEMGVVGGGRRRLVWRTNIHTQIHTSLCRWCVTIDHQSHRWLLSASRSKWTRTDSLSQSNQPTVFISNSCLLTRSVSGWGQERGRSKGRSGGVNE